MPAKVSEQVTPEVMNPTSLEVGKRKGKGTSTKVQRQSKEVETSVLVPQQGAVKDEVQKIEESIKGASSTKVESQQETTFEDYGSDTLRKMRIRKESGEQGLSRFFGSDEERTHEKQRRAWMKKDADDIEGLAEEFKKIEELLQEIESYKRKSEG